MNLVLLKKIGKCQNCGESNVELEPIEFDNKEREWCSECCDGYSVDKALDRPVGYDTMVSRGVDN